MSDEVHRKNVEAGLARMKQYGGFTEKRLKYISEQLAVSSKKVTEMAKQYNQKYADQITDSERLLENGRSLGKSDDQIFREIGKFMPSIRTPVLNWLYFMLDENQTPAMKAHEEKRKKLDEQHEEKWHEDFEYTNVTEPQDMVMFILGNSTLDTFNKIKKLKTLATNNVNPNEAASAKFAAEKLCEKYDLIYEQIPINS